MIKGVNCNAQKYYKNQATKRVFLRITKTNPSILLYEAIKNYEAGYQPRFYCHR